MFSDVCGPINPPTYEGFRYIINFVDAYSSACFVYFLKSKDTADKALEQFIADTAPFGKILHLHTDNGGEYISAQFKQVLRERGIKHTTTAPYTPSQNGKAERNWRTLMDMARCLLNDSNLPKKYWMHAVRYAAFIRNRAYQRRTSKTAFEMLSKQKPNVQCIHKFGSSCTIYDESHKAKIDPRSVAGIFLGICPLNNAYLVLDPKNDRIKSSRNVRFLSTPAQEAEVRSEDNESEDESEQHSTEVSSEPVRSRTSQRVRREPARYLLEQSYNVLVAYTTKILYEIPDRYEEATNSPNSSEWIRAMNEEICALEENDTWELVELPEDRTEIKGRWVYTTKLNSRGEVDKFKARYVAKGCSQTPGLDFDETFSPTTRMSTIRALLQASVQMGMQLHQMDVKSAYLHAPIDHDVYLCPPEGYKIPNDGKRWTCHLKKSIYGLKQSGRNWNQLLDSFLKEQGFRQSELDLCLYTMTCSNDEILKVIVWVDDLILASTHMSLIDDMKLKLSKRFKIDDRGPLQWFLGLEFRQENDKITINQSAYTDKLLDKFGMSECKPAPTPAAEGQYLSSDDHGEPNDNFDYRGLIGGLLYLSVATRPDISWVTSKLSQFLQSPTNTHITAAKRVLRYLKGTSDWELSFCRVDDPELVGFCEPDWGSSPDDRRSTSAYVFNFNGITGPISWRARKQPSVALSSCEAEYLALGEAAKEAKYLRQLLSEMKLATPPTSLRCDNQGAMSLAKNPSHHQRTKHIDVRHHFIRDLITSGEISVCYVPSSDNLADALTKPLGRVRFGQLAAQIKGAC